MTFRAPFWLWLAAAAPVLLLFLLVRERSRTRLARRFVSERLRGVSNPARMLRPYLLAAAWVAATVALAGPENGYTTLPVVDRETNRVIAIDVSNSMAAEDVGVSRLAAAKAIAKQLVEQTEGRSAIVVFERAAEVIAPLTNDDQAVVALLDTLQPGEVGEPGSDLAVAIDTSLRLLQAETSEKAGVIVISDGEEQGSRLGLAEALHRARTRGIEISAIAIGTAAGGTIPSGSEVLRDDNGEIVVTHEKPDVLQRIARSTGGRFLDNPFQAGGLAPLMAQRSVGGERRRPVRVPVDRYQWPLALAFAAFFCGSLVNRGAE